MGLSHFFGIDKPSSIFENRLTENGKNINRLDKYIVLCKTNIKK